jgi:hypothetical protein
MPQSEKTQLILDQLGNDPMQTRGPRAVKEALNLAGHKIGRYVSKPLVHARSLIWLSEMISPQ